MQAVEVVARAVDRRQPEDRHGEVRVGARLSLDSDLVVVLFDHDLAQRRVLGERQGVGRPGFGSVEAPVRPIDICTRRNDRALRHSLEVEDAPPFFAPERAHVDDDLRLQAAQLAHVTLELVEVAVDVSSSGRQRVLVPTAVEDGDIVTAVEQLAHDERPGELRPAETENPHRLSRARR